ncbi:MAG: haloacid dehalogenase-like hydrolase [Actinomycetia bacterium]|nr:haloacid dehalogenase-like hydrolase [Actinomycetes bacterium]MCP4084036.1 haloacid dehalogenase-like hydrolase [Actinomycetes bacterium]
MPDAVLPSWREGAARTALVAFLDDAAEIPPEQRVAAFDNDGTLWCEKPRYTQLDFFVWVLRHEVEDRPALGSVPEYRAVLSGNMAAIAEMGLERVAVALVGLFEGQEPEQFESRVRAFFAETRHPDTGLRYDQMVYQPMLELLGELERRGFTNCIVTGGGTEFVRAISRRVYGVEQERVVGTLVTYRVLQRDGRPVLVRTDRPQGEANEGETKISNIQVGLGRRPVLAAGNSPGDADMLEHTNVMDGPSLALLVNHDDAEREYAYASEAGSFVADEPVEASAARLGWTQVSMRDDWANIFPTP